MGSSEFEISGDVQELPRGGFLMDTPAGYIQFGAPPETIKDTMGFPKKVPDIFVLPETFFNWTKGISVAELEFPIYFNFFLNRRPTYIICSREQYVRFRRVLQEAVFGPEHLDLQRDFAPDWPHPIPDLKKEMSFFGGFKLSDMVKFGLFENNSFTFRGVKIEKTDRHTFRTSYDGKVLGEVPGRIPFRPNYNIGERLIEPYRPPRFGITCLGPSHGFDPQQNTSGFILWLNQHGVMIDPPVNSTEWLLDSNVNPKYIDSIILTHCHADHDAGTLQKILEERKITIYTTRTIMDSFLTKYATFCGVTREYLQSLFRFSPVQVGRPFFIQDAKFQAFYTLHSIPTIGFRLDFAEQSFVYSSDHNNDPEIHNTLLEKGVIDQHRYDELRNFPWDSTVIYHEAGIAPLHTPVAVLNSLPEEIQKKIIVYHIAESAFPEETNLTLAKFGIQHTLDLDALPARNEEAMRILTLLHSLDFFENLPLLKVREFLSVIRKEIYGRGECIVKKGDPGDRFFMILSGNVSVRTEGFESEKIYGAYDYFGEVSMLTGQSRTADVYAETDVEAYSIEKDKFLNFIAGTEFESTLQRLVIIRDHETWNLISQSEKLQFLTTTQKTQMESYLQPDEALAGTIFFKEGDEIEKIYLIREGEVEVSKDGVHVAKIGRGDFIGEMHRIQMGQPAMYTFTAITDTSLYSIKNTYVYRFIQRYPGVIMKLKYDFNT